MHLLLSAGTICALRRRGEFPYRHPYALYGFCLSTTKHLPNVGKYNYTMPGAYGIEQSVLRMIFS